MEVLRPPRPRPVLTVGVTGHRRLEDRAAQALELSIGTVLHELGAACRDVVRKHSTAFDGAPFDPILLSALAEGADQIAAEVALAQGWTLNAVLPFPLETYAKDFEGVAAERFRGLLGRASHWWSLPPSGERADEGYALVGQVTAAQSDLLIAVWDGYDARGLGGTADVVEYAIRRGVPVIWVRADAQAGATIMWSGFDNLSPALLDRMSAPQRHCDAARLLEVATRLLAPPRAPEDRISLKLFFGERQRLFRFRPEYPLMLALTGTRPMSRSQFRVQPYAHAAKSEWAEFRKGIGTSAQSQAGLDALELAYGWSDALATHYAQTYRGGLVFNYTAAGVSVLLALTGLLVHHPTKVMLGIGELVTIAALIINTTYGGRTNWHRRWLDYRYLAERLRPLRSLRLLGAAIPGFSLSPTGVTKWTDWYAQALWRQLPPPAALGSPEEVDQLAEQVALHELDSQIAYNHSNAKRMHHLDHRLHQVGTALFYAAIGVGIYGLIGHSLHIELPILSGTVLTVFSAGLPTIGSALFGIRGHADFSGAAGRSEATAERLQILAKRLRSHPMDLATAARAAEDSAATMLKDLDEWHVSYRHRKLVIPS